MTRPHQRTTQSNLPATRLTSKLAGCLCGSKQGPNAFGAGVGYRSFGGLCSTRHRSRCMQSERNGPPVHSSCNTEKPKKYRPSGANRSTKSGNYAHEPESTPSALITQAFRVATGNKASNGGEVNITGSGGRCASRRHAASSSFAAHASILAFTMCQT